MIPYCNTLACKPEVHFFVNLDIWAFGANGLHIRIGQKGPHSMVVSASGGPINQGAPPKGFETYINSASKTACFGFGGALLAIVGGNSLVGAMRLKVPLTMPPPPHCCSIVCFCIFAS